MKKIIKATLLAIARVGVLIGTTFLAGAAYEKGRKFGKKDVSKLTGDDAGRMLGFPVAMRLFGSRIATKVVEGYMKYLPDTPEERARKRREARDEALRARRTGVRDL